MAPVLARVALVVLLACLVNSVSSKRPRHHDNDNDHDNSEGEEDDGGFLDGLGAMVILGIIVTIIFGIISLVTWLVCCCRGKSRRVAHQDKRGNGLRVAPTWSHQLVSLPQFNMKGFGKMSDGMDQVDIFHVIRTRQSTHFTDGARWEVPMTSGKHVFEIIWPWGERGLRSTIGVGTAAASLKVKGQRSLVGNDAESWGFDITRRTLSHGGHLRGRRCPPDGSFVPDKFMMYVDLDEGKLSFGVDVTFWGEAFSDLPRNGGKPLYLMVGTDKWHSAVRAFYKGSADPNAMVHTHSHGMAPYGLPLLPAIRNPMNGGMVQPPAYVEVAPAGLTSYKYKPATLPPPTTAGTLAPPTPGSGSSTFLTVAPPTPSSSSSAMGDNSVDQDPDTVPPPTDQTLYPEPPPYSPPPKY